MIERVVLLVCVENACRSLMAEAFFNRDPPAGWIAQSAGTRPASAPNPRTGPMLAEVGVFLPPHLPRLLRPETIDTSTIQVTIGCLDDASCPAHPKSRADRDWELPDPAALDHAGFRRARDTIRRRVDQLIEEIEHGGHGAG